MTIFRPSALISGSSLGSEPSEQPRSMPAILPSSRPSTGPRPIPLYRSSGIGPVLLRVMEQSGTHQAEVARRMNVRPQSLNQYVKLKRSKPSLEWLLHFLQVNGAYLAIVFPENGRMDRIIEAAELLETKRVERETSGDRDSQLTDKLAAEPNPAPNPLG